MKLLAGNSNLPLARSISDYLESRSRTSVRRFAEEVFVEINENVRGEDVFVLQSTSASTIDNLGSFDLHRRRARVGRGSPPTPYFGYARQDRKPGLRTDLGQAGRDHHRRRRQPCLSIDLRGQIRF
jgi:ribose-phosphate pyrophosphokinase